MQETNNILQINKLTVGYGKQDILQNLSFDVPENEILGIVGQNGSGKSTLLKAIYGLVKPQNGTVSFKGTNITNLRPDEKQKRGIAYCLQGGLIFPTLTVAEHLKLATKKGNYDKAYSQFPELHDLLKKRAGNLSGGQRQILSLSMLLLQDADLWLLDEPTSGLSAKNTEKTLEFLQEIKKQRNKTMLIVEHNYDFVFQLIDKAIIIKEQTATPKFKENEFKNPAFVQENIYF